MGEFETVMPNPRRSEVEFDSYAEYSCVISGRKARHLDVTTMFTYSNANTPLSQSERAHYLSYFISDVSPTIRNDYLSSTQHCNVETVL